MITPDFGTVFRLLGSRINPETFIEDDLSFKSSWRYKLSNFEDINIKHVYKMLMYVFLKITLMKNIFLMRYEDNTS